MIDLPTDLPADLVPLSWLLGVWEGTGVIDYHADGRDFAGEFHHRVSFSHDGGDFINYAASAWLLPEGEADDADAERVALVSEIGYWRLARAATDEDAGPGLLPPVATRATPRTADNVEALRNAQGSFDLEVAIVHSDAVMELYVGTAAGPRIDLTTDAVLRPASAKVYTAASRMFGYVDGHLLWAWDIAAVGGELASHASARLARAE